MAMRMRTNKRLFNSPTALLVVYCSSLLLWSTFLLVEAQPPPQARQFDTQYCRCEKPAEHFYASDGSDGYYAKWMFPRDQNDLIMIGDVTVLPMTDPVCAEPAQAAVDGGTPTSNGGKHHKVNYKDKAPPSGDLFVRRFLRQDQHQRQQTQKTNRELPASESKVVVSLPVAPTHRQLKMSGRSRYAMKSVPSQGYAVQYRRQRFRQDPNNPRPRPKGLPGRIFPRFPAPSYPPGSTPTRSPTEGVKPPSPSIPMNGFFPCDEIGIGATQTPTQAPVIPASTQGPTPALIPESTNAPTRAPVTAVPTRSPTSLPTRVPTVGPTGTPTSTPTGIPTQAPVTAAPLPVGATSVPTGQPTSAPTGVPTTLVPTTLPSDEPSGQPSISSIPTSRQGEDTEAPSASSQPTAVGGTDEPTISFVPTSVGDTESPTVSSQPTLVAETDGPTISNIPTSVGETQTPTVSSPPTSVTGTDEPTISSVPTSVRETQTPTVSSQPTSVTGTDGPTVSSVPTSVGETQTPTVSSQPTSVAGTDGPTVSNIPTVPPNEDTATPATATAQPTSETRAPTAVPTGAPPSDGGDTATPTTITAQPTAGGTLAQTTFEPSSSTARPTTTPWPTLTTWPTSTFAPTATLFPTSSTNAPTTTLFPTTETNAPTTTRFPTRSPVPTPEVSLVSTSRTVETPAGNVVVDFAVVPEGDAVEVTVDLPEPQGWVAFGVNPAGLSMSGTTACIYNGDPSVPPELFEITGKGEQFITPAVTPEGVFSAEFIPSETQPILLCRIPIDSTENWTLSSTQQTSFIVAWGDGAFGYHQDRKGSNFVSLRGD